MLVSSHLMSELEDTADHLVVIGRGRLIADTSVRDLVAAASKDQILHAPGRSEAMTLLANAGATVAASDRETLTVSGLPAERVVALLGERGLPVIRGHPAPGLAGGGVHGADPRRRRLRGRRRGGVVRAANPFGTGSSWPSGPSCGRFRADDGIGRGRRLLASGRADRQGQRPGPRRLEGEPLQEPDFRTSSTSCTSP